jgi:SAM-dependent methyltransferase
MLWDVLYERYLPREPGLKALEIGSAPGDYLIRLSRRFGYEPFGVEYSEAGAELNQKVFADNGFPAENVILNDFFDEGFLDKHAEAYDLVISRGFIEHFDDPKSVVEKHLRLLRQGGTLVVSIPNLLGYNMFSTKFFDPQVIPKHNLKIMQLMNFKAAFDFPGLTPQFCDYFGRFQFAVVGSARNSIVFQLHRVCSKLQMPLNALQRLVWRDRGIGNGTFGARLMFIGKKA